MQTHSGAVSLITTGTSDFHTFRDGLTIIKVAIGAKAIEYHATTTGGTTTLSAAVNLVGTVPAYAVTVVSGAARLTNSTGATDVFIYTVEEFTEQHLYTVGGF